MATQKPPPPKPEESAPERKTREEQPERLPARPEEPREDGMPGYGQPDEEVREKSLPDQPW
ncbi:hypothetical protein OWM54_02775 [Myxococcus sp. MISCRS1]|jgi:hypothetical protein|uniref:hypothetical protein n=1 Tax=Myxococcus TaxID=32 RepID=UPI001CBB7C0B|nr:MULTISPECIES: hypothetical protein [unclassified Myxococcus]MBZ4399996.1 hypothetical protein [Myxococcus sp. AS-1-15]MBZ4412291.1 hypothetical protein [Myxococcus sp. XM-1-1-1]MCY0996052.1 hypothetical protein [Myxococcus sp. MISCRS1]BDT33967.1 hypothetical protein MFMH1_36360 [Myxococcus sp. MH1]